MSEWRPTAEFSALRRRAQLLAAVRAVFAERGVVEVDTPLLASAPVTDPNIEAICTNSPEGEGQMYLQTSPEFAMKRLLAAGSGPIYQICKAFRRGERGRRHNPEFTMLEWYRPGLSLQALMEEVATIVALVVGAVDSKFYSYQQVFEQHCGLNPHQASLAELKQCAAAHLEVNFDTDDRDTWLQLLMSSVVEPQLDRESLSFVYDFPASQAALAKTRIDANGVALAARFEGFYAGMELANGYDELCDGAELVRRIRDDHSRRAANDQELPPIDRNLLKAMSSLPECVGVAMGFDRLAMLACKAERIDEVIAFPLERA
ncbi:Elongation factor P--(R)-beta-lysine ligase [Zhongshania aliphaticivorans]|uniref:Elongation factor P--(R)-beta-lysine ligase n=1 Tax=Zhongshania aliphaticivorans TaxID=1470434 RepID=A0A5S9MXB2_9GAMM|nr:EF-P lysine aminoacylase EpmA [Zhongshania aliphaticivorans]CAA0081797.1 Elongation factor P--(R)-beta-lysine ligase [Zhongshania aliphaticivorans]CAA0084748.1 Elongation factor P--(R)-beta-lysine ligase [Zhongshania aliphaticivorans]